jgi:peroxiredoxin
MPRTLSSKLTLDYTAEFLDKKVVLVAVPGAFTRTCSEKHVPSFVQNQDALRAKGVDKVVVIAYNGMYYPGTDC